jgi:hypothetical protein
MYMDEQSAVQMKILRLVMLADNYCTRIGHDVPLMPPEALAYKQICDFIRAHVRMMELHTIIAINKLEEEIYGPQPKPERPESQRDEPPRRVAEQSDRPTTPRPRLPEEDGGLGDSPGGVPSGSPN